ncbi:MAG: hypothetical protein JWN30_619 [Bacilli bacterium]|nr:hypothetical protein [Bacilli bacterium]
MILIQNRIPNLKCKEVFQLIRRTGVVSKFELLEQSSIGTSTLTRLLDELTSDGLLNEVGYGASTGGRRPILYEINQTYAYVFGLDVSRTHSKLILFDLRLNQLDAIDWQMSGEFTPQFFIEKVKAAIKRMMNRHRLSIDSILGMGIGAVGPLDRQRGVILSPLHFSAPGWENVEICRAFENEFDFPVGLDNGANTSILGEYWVDTPQEYQHLLYVHAGVGLRSAMMSGGQVVYGAFDMEGSVGQMIIQSDGEPPRHPSGNYGALESYVSIYALEQKAKSLLKQGRASLLTQYVDQPEQANFAHLLEALAANDVMVTEIFTQAATCLGIGLANLLNILHPEKVILGGMLLTTNHLFFETAKLVALAKTYYYPAYQVEFIKGQLGEDALATGAAVMMINRLTA